MAPDPGQVHTAAELALALKEMAGGRSYAELHRAARPDRLPKATLTDMFGKGRPSEETLEVFLRACGVPREDRAAWRQARRRALTADPDLDGLIRVAQADPRRLGVHAPIDAPGAAEDLPAYIQRDVDDGPRGVRELVDQAAQRGGLVVLVGGSSVGKTRCAYEAIRDLLPEWWLLHPAGARHIEQAAAAGPERLVVWLDELQRYLDGSRPLTAATVRTLLHRRAVLIATLWPDRYTTYTQPPKPDRPDPHADARELLGPAEVVHLDAELSPAEHERARTAAEAGDARITLGLESDDYGLFQVIAAAPQLIDRWRGADPYAAAVLTAAVDATRLGVRSPLSAELLREAAPGYCDARQRGNAPANWFEASLAYLTQELHGAAAVLAPIAAPGTMGRPVGYQLADYLQQHLGERRRTAKVPATTWHALASHLTDPDDQVRTCVAALNRLLYDYVLQVLPSSPHTGDLPAVDRLAHLLAEHGRMEEAIALLTSQADAGNRYAAQDLADLLVRYGREDQLRARADAGDRFALHRLADLVAEQGREEELRARADAGDRHAAERLAELLAEHGHVEEAITILRTADPDDGGAAAQLATLLAAHGREAELRARADTGDSSAAQRLMELLVEQGREGELRARADTGDQYAVKRLAELLAKQGHAEEAMTVLRTADPDDMDAATQLAGLLLAQDRAEEALAHLRAQADAGRWLAHGPLAGLLAICGQEEELRARADAGDWAAAAHLADLLGKHGRFEELRARVDAGDEPAARRLATALAKAGRTAEAERVRRFGLPLEDG
ncbi:tetratricopeptide repeat protein [Nonomuraea rhodomycinica]|uniref:Tetratricopeptide repeat-containing protein n=1 Tax=Nonomuraea rhodomycinica TaxID=1712872 RepID=A0A7Y6IJS8_9ACTN|nr:hypothetical protein [Nonomuraea rhodomycinica]NUW39577.1 hypothetical protein [Nonomuraea rhodomycinica]